MSTVTIVMGICFGVTLAGCSASPATPAGATPTTKADVAVLNPTSLPSPTSTTAPQSATATALPTVIPPTFTATPVLGIIDIPDVPTYPGITKTIQVNTLARSRKCGDGQSIAFHNYSFLVYDVYYRVDYGREGMSKDEKRQSPVNQQIVDYYHAQFEAEGWHVADEEDPQESLHEVIAWEDEERAATPGPGEDEYEGACYLVRVFVQPTSSADLHIVAMVERDE